MRVWILLLLSVAVSDLSAQILRRKVPDKLVVLTFDDAVLSHYTNVAPLLKKHKFGATFFIAEFKTPPFSDKTKYMSWEQIGELDRMGFEVGNHTRNHSHVNKLSAENFVKELQYIDSMARNAGVKNPLTSFAYPGYDIAESALPVLQGRGYYFARTGGRRAYDPLKDHPYLVPSFSTSGDNSKDIYAAFEQAKDGKVVVLTIHGVPDDAHPWVNTPLPLFEEYLRYLKNNRFKVVALRQLARYVNVANARAELKPDFKIKNK